MRGVNQPVWSEEEEALRRDLFAGEAVACNGHRQKAWPAWAAAHDPARYITAFRPQATIWGNPYRPKGRERGAARAHQHAGCATGSICLPGRHYFPGCRN